ncbi:MAG: hypothetical protein GWN86_15205, partial [Desulfobacterales bacterium]|nr:hypothetical protein [Desulfobacterales bacterium]
MIAVRKAIDYMRRGRSARPAEQNPGDSENSRDYSDEKPDPEEELINSEEKEIIAEAVKRLP